jgi:hypothetical protein
MVSRPPLEETLRSTTCPPSRTGGSSEIGGSRYLSNDQSKQQQATKAKGLEPKRQRHGSRMEQHLALQQLTTMTKIAQQESLGGRARQATNT